MDTRILLASNGGRHGPRVTSHESPVTSCKLFRFTLLSKNASANHLESHSCKNKGLKVPCFHTLTKKGVGEGRLRVSKPEMVVLLVLRYEGSEHREPVKGSGLVGKDPSESCKPFRLIHFRKKTSATPLVSHSFKTKDLKPFRFTHFQKKGGGYPWFPLSAASCSDHTHRRFLFALDSQ